MTLAKARIPRDEGRWASTLKVRALKRRKGRVGVVIRVGTRAELGIDPQQRGFYPAHQEFGHRDRAGVHHPPMAPMRISLRTGESGILGIVRQEIEAGIAAAMRGPA